MKVVLIGARSKPDEISGQTIAFDMLVDEMEGHGNFVIDINCYSETPWRKITAYIKSYLVFTRLLTTKAVSKTYLTISQSKVGFLRDFGFIWIAALFNKKIIVHLHGGNYKHFYDSQSTFFQKIIRSTLARVDIFVVLSTVFKDVFSFIPGSASKIRVVPNGIESPSDSQREKELEAPIRLLYLSNLIESKGYLDVLHAVKLLKEKWERPIEIAFCGKFLSSADDVTFTTVAEAEQYFFDYISSNQLSNVVRYAGVVKGIEKEAFLKNAHFILLPSYYISEGQPISLLEGLAYGCVPVCTDYRDLANIVRNNWNGLIVEKKNPMDIALRIMSVTKEQYTEMSKNSRRFFLANYTREKHIFLLKSIFEERL